VELLAALIVTGLWVRVVVDDLDRPLGILELHLLIVGLVGNLLLAFPLAGSYAVIVRLLLLLLMELFHKVLDLPTLLSIVVPGVVHQAPRPALIAVGELARSLVTVWAMAPTSCCCDSSNSGSACQQLVVVIGLLLIIILVLTATLSSSNCFKLLGLLQPWRTCPLG
jgi:hypothetical protein